MADSEQTVCVYDIQTAGDDQLKCSSMEEIANFVTEHPRRSFLRVEGKAFRQPLTADEFLAQVELTRLPQLS